MPNYQLEVSYDGNRYYGWEHQPDQPMTIQGKIETVLARMLSPEEGKPGEIPKVIGAGRTDAGVHARAMVANVVMEPDRTPEEIQDYLNRYLPDDISVNDVRIASDRFHARYNVIRKTYCYSLYCGHSKPVFDRKYVTVLDEAPNLQKMQEAAEYLKGTHDYKSFCGNSKMKKSTVRNVEEIRFEGNWPRVKIYYTGSGFLQNMVRILTGTLLEVGYGRLQPEDMERILEAKDRRQAGPTAPPEGLMLMRIDY